MEMKEMITITSKQKGFRRCGIAHDDTATSYADDAFTAAQLKTLQAEPMLTVQIEKTKKEADKTAAGDPGKKEKQE
jgi:uncharacterized protein YunC (DUF1805 family)